MKKKKGIVITVVICAIVLWSATKSYSETNKIMHTANIIVRMQCEVKGEGEPIVLVGGGLTGWKSWEPFVGIFTAKKRKVIRLQLIAVQYGLENRGLPDNYSVKVESCALQATLDSLGFDYPVDVVAWSFGALISLDYALDHPEKIRTLTLIEPPAIWVLRETGRFDGEMQKTADFLLTFKGDITSDMLADFLAHAGLVPPGKSPRNLPQWEGWIPFRQSLHSNPYPVTFRDSIQRLGKFQAPVLLVKGTGSVKWLHQVIDVLAENIPQARVVEYPEGHAPHLVSSENFLSELGKFQKELK